MWLRLLYTTETNEGKGASLHRMWQRAGPLGYAKKRGNERLLFSLFLGNDMLEPTASARGERRTWTGGGAGALSSRGKNFRLVEYRRR